MNYTCLSIKYYVSFAGESQEESCRLTESFGGSNM